MDFNTFQDFARGAVVDYIRDKYGVEVKKEQLLMLWFTTAMEIRKMVFWRGQQVFVVGYNDITEETTIDEYIKKEG